MKIFNKDGKIIVDYPNAKTYREVLLESFKDGFTDFDEANLEGMKLQNLNLENITLDRANCKGTDFTGTSFGSGRSMFSFACSSLISVDFTDAILIDVKFMGVDLEESVFLESNLTRANFAGAECKEVSFVGAVMTGTVFDKDTELFGADGNGKEVISIETDLHKIVITKGEVHIGLSSCSIEEFLNDEDIGISYFTLTFPTLQGEIWFDNWRPEIIKIINKAR